MSFYMPKVRLNSDCQMSKFSDAEKQHSAGVSSYVSSVFFKVKNHLQCYWESDYFLWERKSPLIDAVLSGGGVYASLEEPKTLKERWVVKAFTGDCDFSKQEFSALPEDIQKIAYRVANIYIQKGFLQKLHDFGMHKTPSKPRGINLLSYSMDALDVESSLKTFLADLHENNCLFTKDEFQSLDQTKWYWKREGGVGRILGRNYVERVASKLGCTRIKVPQKIAVLEKGGPLTFYVAGDLGLGCRDLLVYAEVISSIERKATRDELLELLDVLEETGYNDYFGWGNIALGKNQKGEEGIFFLDNEFGNFSELPKYGGIGGVLNPLIDERDISWLQAELDRRVTLFEQQKDKRIESLARTWVREEKPASEQMGFEDRSKPFIISPP